MSVERTDRDGLLRACEQTVEALISAASQRDKTAEVHSQRVTRNSSGCVRENCFVCHLVSSPIV
jgi:hypothetical protein